MPHYYLFLDECNPTAQMRYFVLGGCVIEEKAYHNNVMPHVNTMKMDIWGNTEVILHEFEIREASADPYRVLRTTSKREKFWLEMRNVFSMDCVNTIGVAIDCDEYPRLYKSLHRNNEYLVALHLLIENFAHFLEKRGGTGSVFVESRNQTEDIRLGNLYHDIKATGTLFWGRNIYQQRLGQITFPVKTDNNIGLQLADFVPNPISREAQGKKQKTPNIHEHIIASLYCGDLGMQTRFGLKKIP